MNIHTKTTKHYIAEKQFFNHLAGLRGIAIVLVVLFHLCPEIFVHGYFGVDIFLVITGYLLFCGLSRNDGSLKSTGIFAYKKLQRIIPGVSICVILTIIAGVYFLDAEVMANSARTARDTVLGLSNIQLAKALSDYFAAEATENPLLHMCVHRCDFTSLLDVCHKLHDFTKNSPSLEQVFTLDYRESLFNLVL